ncbi:MAG: enoyl-CoA hydratase/isomerase family protein [Alphaproteobacteria bacterium]
MAQIEVTRDGAVAVCTITPPDIYMNIDTVAELDRVSADLADDAGVRAVIFTGGHAGVFIQHYDVAELAQMAGGLREKGFSFSPDRPVKPRQLDAVFERFATMDKPVIAALNGNAMGGGFELALASDIRVTQPGDWSFGLPEINLGILPGAGGTQRLARLVGQARALEMVLRGRTVSPDEALKLGMVHEVCVDGALIGARRIAAEIASKTPLAVRHIKHLIRNVASGPLDDGLGLERTLFLDLLVQDEAVERMTAFDAGGRDIRRVSRDT